MIKSELVWRIARQNPHLYQRDVENILNAVLGEVVSAMARGDRVELRGFGAFSVSSPSANGPQSYRAMQEKAFPIFRTAKEVRERLNKSQSNQWQVTPPRPTSGT
jgi:integration host factor subunit beta